MSHRPKILVQILSRRSCLQPCDLFNRILRFDKTLPELRPSVCNWTDPINKPWDMEHLEDLLPTDFGLGNAGSVYWKRKLPPKAEGVFGVAIHNGRDNSIDQHSNSKFTVNLDEVNVDHLVNYLIEDAYQDADIAQLHVMTDQERARRKIELSYSGHLEEYSTFVLRHWLPELPWGVIFGEAYVKLFGMERLLTAPAYKVRRLSNQAVYIQLSPCLSDLRDDYNAVDAVRQKVKDHIGRDAFFDVSKAYALELMGEIPADQWVKLYTEFKPLSPGSTGFKVPDFHFIKDGEQTLSNHPKVSYQTENSVNTKYDDASWHYGGEFPANLAAEAGVTHMAMYWVWAISSGLGYDPKLTNEISKKLRSNIDSPGILFSKKNGEKLTDSDLSPEGKAFTDHYYSNIYFNDYAKAFEHISQIYQVEDSWENFSKISTTLNQRLSEWKNPER